MSFELKWNDNINKQLEEAMANGMENAMEELREETYNLSRVDTEATRDSYETAVMVIDEGTVEGQVGSNHKLPPSNGKVWNNAILEEFGTGEYAENNDGRKGGWVYKKGDEYFFTYGKKPNKPMRRALSRKKDSIGNIIGKELKEEFKT